MNKEFFSNVFSVNSVVSKAMSDKISVTHQFFSLIIFYVYQRGLIFDLFDKKETSERYFNHPQYIGDIIFFFGVVFLVLILRKRNISSLLNIYFSSFLPCQIWTWIVFSIYLAITIPINFFAVQNLYGEPWPFLSGVGYLIYNTLPFILLFLAIKRASIPLNR